MPAVVAAGAADRAQVIETVVRAFGADPAWGWMCAGEYERVAPLFAGALFDSRVARGTIWMTAGCTAVSLWDGPGAAGANDGLWQRFRSEAGPAAADRVTLYGAAIERHHPALPHWYLGVLACDPAHRRQGLATAVMQPGLEQADSAGLSACLETSTLDNRRFYAARGFTSAVAVELSGAPQTWWLTRPPASTPD